MRDALEQACRSGADLSGANLYGANLSRADLSRADLSGADLSGANLYGADLSGAKNAELAIAQTRILPDGDLIGWKKCLREVIVKLRIPAEAKRSHAFGRKCRAEWVQVLEVIGGEVATSMHDGTTTYRVGETVRPDSWSDNWQDECAGGIHSYITRAEAEAHSCSPSFDGPPPSRFESRPYWLKLSACASSGSRSESRW